MNPKSILVLLVLGTVSLSNAQDLAEQHKEGFAKLNKYLEEEVKSDDPVLNRAALEKLLEGDSSESKMDILKKLINFTGIEADYQIDCRVTKDTELAEELDSGLADESRVETPNYPLTRIDKILQHYAFIIARYCRFRKDYPKMKFGFKQLDYDQINNMLVEELPESEDIDANMAKAEELLKTLEPKDGALAEALKQFLELKLTLNDDTCNEKGHEILSKNKMSTGLSDLSQRLAAKTLRRVDKIFVHYSLKHEQLCRPVVVEKLKTMVKELNPNTYRKVLGLASARFVHPSKVSNFVEDLNGKPIDENFFTPLLAQRVEQKLATYSDDEATFDLIHIYIGNFDKHHLLGYLQAVSQGDPNSEFLASQVDERAGGKHVNEAKVKQILDEYLLEPCRDYMKSFSGIILADWYDARVNDEHKKSRKSKAMSELTYHFANYAYQSCRALLRKESSTFEGIKEAIVPSRGNL